MAAGETGRTFSLSVVAGLIAAGVAAFAAFLLLAAYAGDFRSGRDGRAHALSVSAVGFKGLTRLLDAMGDDPAMIRSELDLDTEDLLVIALEERLDQDALVTLVERRSSKPTLIILPKWYTAPDPINQGWVAKAGPVDPAFIGELIGDLGDLKISQTKTAATAAGTDLLRGLSLPAPALSQTLSGENTIPLLTVEGRALLAQVGDRPLYILADPDIMNNHGLAEPATARAAAEIIGRLNSTGAETVSFDLTLNGFGREANALKLLLEPPFLALALAVLAAAVLAGIHGAFRFGPERRPERLLAFGKAALVDNSAGLLRMARREHRAGGAYAELMREEAARGAGVAATLKGDALDAYLDRISGREPRFTDLAARLEAADDRYELLQAARALFQWKKDISQ